MHDRQWRKSRVRRRRHTAAEKQQHSHRKQGLLQYLLSSCSEFSRGHLRKNDTTPPLWERCLGARERTPSAFLKTIRSLPDLSLCLGLLSMSSRWLRERTFGPQMTLTASATRALASPALASPHIQYDALRSSHFSLVSRPRVCAAPYIRHTTHIRQHTKHALHIRTTQRDARAYFPPYLMPRANISSVLPSCAAGRRRTSHCRRKWRRRQYKRHRSHCHNYAGLLSPFPRPASKERLEITARDLSARKARARSGQRHHRHVRSHAFDLGPSAKNHPPPRLHTPHSTPDAIQLSRPDASGQGWRQSQPAFREM